MIFFISSIAETNRAPFDLAEAESELVSGFMTEHAAGIFVFFFLAEYASIILMCILITIVLLGGYEILSILEYFNLFVKHVFSFIFIILSNIYVYIEFITSLGKSINYYIFNIDSNYNEYLNLINYYS